MASASGGQSPTQQNRTIERLFEDAQSTGEIDINSRNLKEYPSICNKYDLSDTTSVDLSRNRLSEVPPQVCRYASLERLHLYQNVLKHLPQAISQLTNLVQLNLTRNQLTTLPVFLCRLRALEVLHASHNRLVSLPEEIGELDNLMDLDVSCNEISHLPVQIGDLSSLKNMDLRRNMLVELPVEIARLRLQKLDLRSNRIAVIPPELRRMEDLETLRLEHNPLTSPAAHLCTRGRVHVMKYLQQEAVREDRRRGALCAGDSLDLRRPPSYRGNTLPASGSGEDFRSGDSPAERDRRKRNTLDSGYNTTDSSAERARWSPVEPGLDVRMLGRALLRVVDPPDRPRRDVIHTTRMRVGMDVRGRDAVSREPQSVTSSQSVTSPESQHPVTMLPARQQAPLVNGSARGKPLTPVRVITAPVTSQPAPADVRPSPSLPRRGSTPGSDPFAGYSPVVVSGGAQSELMDEFTRELQRQRSEYEQKKRAAEELRMRVESGAPLVNGHGHQGESGEEELAARRRVAARLQEEQKAIMDRSKERRPWPADRSPAENTRLSADSSHSSLHNTSFHSLGEPANDVTRPVPDPSVHDNHVAGRQPAGPQFRRAMSDVTSHQRPLGGDQAWDVRDKLNTSLESSQNYTYANHDSYYQSDAGAEELRSRHEALMTQQRHEAQVARRRVEEERQRSQGHPAPRYPGKGTPETAEFGYGTEAPVVPNRTNGVLPAGAARALEEMSADLGALNPGFTVRRHLAALEDERAQVAQLRSTIEARLKISLPDDLAAALRDGVVLCHLANHVRPRSVTSIHVPSPSAVSIHVPSPSAPKLTTAKCRRNVESFLDACRRIGVSKENLCSSAAVLEERPGALMEVALTVQTLLTFSANKQSIV